MLNTVVRYFELPKCRCQRIKLQDVLKLWLLKLTVVLDYYEAKETYSRIGLLRSQGNLRSYWTITKPRKLTVVLDYYEAMKTYSRIGLLRRYGNFQSYWTTTELWKLTVVLDYYEDMETFSRIGLLRRYGNFQSYWNIYIAPTAMVFMALNLAFCREKGSSGNSMEPSLTKTPTRFEWNFESFPLALSVDSNHFHSFRV